MRIIDWNDTPDAVGNRGFEIADGGGGPMAGPNGIAGIGVESDQLGIEEWVVGGKGGGEVS